MADDDYPDISTDENRGDFPADMPKLDAYGHMNWTVGNEDWLACFDAIRKGEGLSYHVVVNCESGGFIDTLETGEIKFIEKNQIENLKCFPDHWADICRENYIDSRKRAHQVKVREVARTRKDWAKHIDELIAEGPCREGAECGCCAECLEPGPDPIRDGWVGKDGQP